MGRNGINRKRTARFSRKFVRVYNGKGNIKKERENAKKFGQFGDPIRRIYIYIGSRTLFSISTGAIRLRIYVYRKYETLTIFLFPGFICNRST